MLIFFCFATVEMMRSFLLFQPPVSATYSRWQVIPDVIAMTACMDALAAGGKWSEAIKILDEMRSKGITPNERTYKVGFS